MSTALVARLTDEDWDYVFGLGDAHGTSSADRFNLEVVVSSVLRKAKSSILYREFKPDPDGSYHAEISNEWWMQIRGCSRMDGLVRFRDRLLEMGLLERGRIGSRQTGRGTIYCKLRLRFDGPQPELPASPRELVEVAREMGEDLPYLEYCLVIEQRFPGRTLTRRYGRRPALRARIVASRVRESLRRLSTAGEPNSNSDSKSLPQPFRTVEYGQDVAEG